ncbi:MAG: C25 family peptidase propeptide domain-containing protein [candidate division WOR-3 bacterium]
MRVAISIFIGINLLFSARWISFDGSTSPTPPSINIISGDRNHIKYEIVLHGMLVEDTTIDGETYQILDLPGEGTTSEVGKPRLPQINRMIALSPNSSITVILDSLEGLSLSNYNVFPFSEAEINDGVSGSFLKDTSTYQ